MSKLGYSSVFPISVSFVQLELFSEKLVERLPASLVNARFLLILRRSFTFLVIIDATDRCVIRQ
jgi:hypothetical protein